MALILQPNLCLLFFSDPEGDFTAKRLKLLLRGQGATVTGRKAPFVVRWRDGPQFYLSIDRGTYVQTLLSRIRGRYRKHRKLMASCDTQIEIQFDSLDEVLYQINDLIDLQLTLQEATKGLLYLSWNQTFSGPGE